MLYKILLVCQSAVIGGIIGHAIGQILQNITEHVYGEEYLRIIADEVYIGASVGIVIAIYTLTERIRDDILEEVHDNMHLEIELIGTSAETA